MRHSILGAIWQELPADPDCCARLSRDLGLSALVARALVARGIADRAQANIYLRGGLDDLHDPLLMRDMPQAVATLRRAVESRQPIRIYGDYDADGITATALLVRALSALGATVDYYLPHRIADGYGLNTPAIEQAARDSVKLLVTVDCGISAAPELSRARELGLDVIVTDHHEPSSSLPPAAAILDPKRSDCCYPFKDLAGVGVAYKLLAALAADLGLRAGAERSFLDLVAIGTIADVVSLTGENRLLVKHGLQALDGTRKHGINALLRAASAKTPVTSYNVAFGLAPRLNAAGRLDHGQAAAALLLTSDPTEARRLADRLSDLNTQRQEEERRTLASAEEMIAAQVDLGQHRLILLAHQEWHPGVIGIVASRLVERYCRPVVLIAVADDAGKGSARSIPGFHMYDALCACASCLEDFGGHALAAGFSLAAGELDSLRQRLLAHAAQVLGPQHLVRKTEIDAWVSPPDLSVDTVADLAAMAPFGAGNPRPVVAVRDVTVQALETCGADSRHLRLMLGQGDVSLRAIWFGCGELAGRIGRGAVVDACGTPEIDEWNGRRSVTLKLRDLAV